MATRNPAYTDTDLYHTNIPMRPVMSSYAKDTPITAPPLSYNDGSPDHTYLSPQQTYMQPIMPGYNTDDVISQCKKHNIYDALGKYSDEHKVDAMRKRNACYESTQFRERTDEHKSIRSRSKKKGNRFCLYFILFLLGFISLGTLTVALLQYFGILNCKGGNATAGE